MFKLPTIVQQIIALLPGIPDDFNIVKAEVAEVTSNDDGLTKAKAALAFAKTMVAKMEEAIAEAEAAAAK